MVKKANVSTRRLKIHDRIFNINSLYKAVKGKIESWDYDFLEAKQSRKSAKYGEEAEIKLYGEFKFDDYCKSEMSVEMFFHNIKKINRDGKQMDRGDALIIITFDWLRDYKNYWGTTRLNKFIHGIYIEYILKKKHKKMYKDVLQEQAKEMLELVKAETGLE